MSKTEEKNLYISKIVDCGIYKIYSDNDFKPDLDFLIPKVYEGKKVSGIGKYSFISIRFNNVFIEEGISFIDEKAFTNCEINNIYIPNSIENISEDSFKNSRVLNYHFQEGVLDVDLSRLEINIDLDEVIIHIPKSVNKINLSGDQNVVFEIDRDNPNYKFENGCLIDKKTDTTIYIAQYSAAFSDFFSEYTFPTTKCINLENDEIFIAEKIIIPEGVEEIKSLGLLKTKEKITISFPKSLKKIHKQSDLDVFEYNYIEIDNNKNYILFNGDLLYIGD